MATRKRRSTRRKTARRRPVTHAASNPAPRRRRRRSVATVHSSSRRRHNPSHRRRHVARRRNPSHTGLFAEGLKLAAGAALVQFTLGFVPPIGGVSPLADAARTAAVGWGLGTAMDRTGFGRQYAKDVTLAGFTLAGGKLITSFILPFASRVFSRPTQPAAQTSSGMSGIALVTGTPPTVLPPVAVPQRSNGVRGISAVPRGWTR